MRVWPEFTMLVVGYLAIGLALAAAALYEDYLQVDEALGLPLFWPLYLIVLLFAGAGEAIVHVFDRIAQIGKRHRLARETAARRIEQAEIEAEEEINRIIAEHRL